jgi:hypothetical protein
LVINLADLQIRRRNPVLGQDDSQQCFLPSSMFFIAASAERSEGRGVPELVLRSRIRLLLLISRDDKNRYTMCTPPRKRGSLCRRY